MSESHFLMSVIVLKLQLLYLLFVTKLNVDIMLIWTLSKKTYRLLQFEFLYCHINDANPA